jgi:glycosyltransferase involved in cell wall biosynthesis
MVAQNSLKKICVLLESYFPIVGGMESEALLLDSALSEKGYQIEVITRRSNRYLKKHEVIDGARVNRIAPSGPGSIKRWCMMITSIFHLIKDIRNWEIVFVSGFRTLGVSAVIVSKMFKKGCILKADNLGEMSGEFFYRGLEKRGFNKDSLLFNSFLTLRNVILKKADAFVSISPKMTYEFRRSGIKPEKLYEIPNCVEQNKFYKATNEEKIKLRSKLKLPLNSKIVIYTGRLVPEKGLPFLLKVWNEIQKKNKNILLLLVGSGENSVYSCEDELKEYVKKNGLENSVIFTGKIHFDKVPEYLQSSDIFVFPSDDEPFGNSLIEAMSCGLASISTSFIIQHDYNGYLIEAQNFKQLYHYLDLLLKNNQLIDELGKNAIRTVDEKYSKTIVTQRYINLFNKI